MSQENVEVVRLAVAAMAQRGLDALAEHWTDDIDHRAVEGALDDRGPIHGKVEMRAYLQDWFDTFDDFRAEPVELIDAGEDQVVAVLRIMGRAKLSGVETDLTYACAYTIRDGKIARGREYRTKEQALEAAACGSRRMSQENVERFLDGLAAFNRGDLDTWVGYIHPDVIFEPIRPPIEGAYRGHAGVRRFFADNRESFESFRLSYTDIRDLGDERLLAIGTLHLRAPGSGIETDLPTAAIATSREGLLIHWKDYGDPRKALEAAGLRE